MNFRNLAANHRLFDSLQVTAVSQQHIETAVHRPPTLGGRACKYCPGAAFSDQDEFRKHYQTAWHTHNQTLCLKSKQPVTEADFEAFSLALSDSESDFWEEEDEEIEESDEDGDVASVSPTVEFACGTDAFQMHRALLFSSKVEYRTAAVTTEMVKRFISNASSSTWAIFLIKSGRLFGGIYDHASGSFTHTKTFRRYTERRKQGGSQMLRDKAGRVAKSAGSQIRRQNEVELLKVAEGSRPWLTV